MTDWILRHLKFGPLVEMRLEKVLKFLLRFCIQHEPHQKNGPNSYQKIYVCAEYTMEYPSYWV